MFDPLPSSIEHIKGGKVLPLAVTTPIRWEGLPDISTVSEFVAGYEASAWQGIAAPKNTPVEIIEKLNKEIDRAVADPKITARLSDIGGMALRSSPGNLRKPHRRRNRKVGQGYPGGQHQGGVSGPGQILRNARSANGGIHQDCTISRRSTDVRFRANRTLEPTWPNDRL